MVELLVAVAVLALLFGGLARYTNSLRNDAKRQQARRLLRTLDAAAELYATVQGVGAPKAGDAEAAAVFPPGSFDADASSGLAALLATPRTRRKLTGLGWPWNRLLDEPQAWADPWGRPLRYVTAVHDAQAVRRNGGQPFWVSAGPDGRFGDADPAERADNISSDEPM